MGKVIAAAVLVLTLTGIAGNALESGDWNTIMEETWSHDRPGSQAHELASWKKLTGFDSSYAKLAEQNGRTVLTFSPEGVAAPFITREQYAVSSAIKLEIQIRRLSSEGSWTRISILSATSRDVGYFVQLYADKIELIRAEGEEVRQIGIKTITPKFPQEEPTVLTIEIDPAENAILVLLDGREVIGAIDSPLLPLDSGIMIGLRAQSGVQAEIASIKLSSK